MAEVVVLYALDNGLLQSASFLAEQLHHSDRSNSYWRYLFALALFREGNTNKAHLISRDSQYLGCAYIFAQTCLILRLYQEGTAALEGIAQEWQNTSHLYSHNAECRKLLPDCAAICCLLGKLYKAALMPDEALLNYTKAVEMNPFLWEAFDGLLSLGVDVQPKSIFRQSEIMLHARQGQKSISSSDGPSATLQIDPSMKSSTATPDMFSIGSRATKPLKSFNLKHSNPLSRLEGLDGAGPSTPTMPSESQQMSLESSIKVVDASRANRTRKLPMNAPKFGLSRGHADLPRRPPSAQDTVATARRSARLVPHEGHTNNKLASFTNRDHSKKAKVQSWAPSNKPSTGQNLDIPSDPPSSTFNTNGSIANKSNANKPMSVMTAENEIALLDLLLKLGEGCFALSKYECNKSIQYFELLAPYSFNTPFVLARMARAHYENARYEKAHEFYQRLRAVDPSRLEDMELYSTCLWHLRKEVELSYLAHEVFDLDKLAACSWCVLANCFSLQREHEQALKCIKRAIQLDPAFAYAHTLEGHEFSANEEYEKAITSFECAIRADKRHYNAWYGLGMSYMKMGRYTDAEYHFNRAYQINSTNAVVICCLGMVLEKTSRTAEALRHYEKACEIAPNNALARFKKAKALILQRNFRSAMNELILLKDLAPEEANVHYLLGKMYKQLGDKNSAVKHLTIALNLDNKASHLVKEALENIDELDDQFVHTET